MLQGSQRSPARFHSYPMSQTWDNPSMDPRSQTQCSNAGLHHASHFLRPALYRAAPQARLQVPCRRLLQPASNQIQSSPAGPQTLPSCNPSQNYLTPRGQQQPYAPQASHLPAPAGHDSSLPGRSPRVNQVPAISERSLLQPYLPLGRSQPGLRKFSGFDSTQHTTYSQSRFAAPNAAQEDQHGSQMAQPQGKATIVDMQASPLQASSQQ